MFSVGARITLLCNNTDKTKCISGPITGRRTKKLIRRPLLARGTRAAGFGLIAFLLSSGHCYSGIRQCFYVFRGPRCRVDRRPQFHYSGSVSSPKVPSCSSVFSRPRKNQKSGSQGVKKTTKFDSEVYKKRILCSQYFPCENRDKEIPNFEVSIKKPINNKNNLETSPKKKKTHCKLLELKIRYTQVPKSLQNRIKSCRLPSRVHPAAPMVPQSSPEVAKSATALRAQGVTSCQPDPPCPLATTRDQEAE